MWMLRQGHGIQAGGIKESVFNTWRRHVVAAQGLQWHLTHKKCPQTAPLLGNVHLNMRHRLFSTVDFCFHAMKSWDSLVQHLGSYFKFVRYNKVMRWYHLTYKIIGGIKHADMPPISCLGGPGGSYQPYSLPVTATRSLQVYLSPVKWYDFLDQKLIFKQVHLCHIYTSQDFRKLVIFKTTVNWEIQEPSCGHESSCWQTKPWLALWWAPAVVPEIVDM